MAPAVRLPHLMVPLLLLSSLAAGCPDDLPHLRECAIVPHCPEAPCCDRRLLCAEVNCQGARWVCSPVYGGTAWIENGASCPTDAGAPPSDSALDGQQRPDLALSCGPHASATPTGCACLQGYVNTDGSWLNGCEQPDPQCGAYSCNHCPAGFCGPHSRCTDTGKCRCASGSWRNDNGDWTDGCELPVSDCSPTNCNSCYVGYCGPGADCMQNRCTCQVPGWGNCDGDWEHTGCECTNL